MNLIQKLNERSKNLPLSHYLNMKPYQIQESTRMWLLAERLWILGYYSREDFKKFTEKNNLLPF